MCSNSNVLNLNTIHRFPATATVNYEHSQERGPKAAFTLCRKNASKSLLN